ncbi:hypothetical protein [Dankookia sp. P2]|uniref:hypothetical protein n=1 Tax=Dankookia sp. P2 TaxID=3423955 RepID=UPI003D665D01
MIKDREQKRMAARFCAAQGLVPFLEVVVRSPASLDESPMNITDIDVVGLELSRAGTTSRTLFDCKTGGPKLTPINRALWAGGLKLLVGAERAFVIQQRETPHSHKLAASRMGILLHTEKTFDLYAASLAADYVSGATYLENPETWDELFAMAGVGPLENLVSFSCTQAALEKSGGRGLRHGLAAFLKAAPELDPAKPRHRLLFGSGLSAYLVFLARAVGELKDVLALPMEREPFEKTLRYFIWEGRENYEIRRQMRAALERARGVEDSSDLLPEWGRLINLMRSLLDAPDALSALPLLAKEMAFRLAQAPLPLADVRLQRMFRQNPRARQFIFAVTAYLVNAAGLPKDFASAVERDVNMLLEAEAIEQPQSGNPESSSSNEHTDSLLQLLGKGGA